MGETSLCMGRYFILIFLTIDIELNFALEASDILPKPLMGQLVAMISFIANNIIALMKIVMIINFLLLA
jgi:hypothetical protein